MKNIVKKCITGLKSKTCAVIGAQWGDEGKGIILIIFYSL